MTIVIDERILDEYDDVLHREYFRKYFSTTDAENIIDFIKHEGEFIVCDRIISSLPDQGDIPFLETALTIQIPLVTGNKKHFPPKYRKKGEITSPKEFIEKYFVV